MESLKLPNEKMLELMIIEEERRRMSIEYQTDCTRVKDIPNGWLDVTAQMQKDVVASFGITDKMSSDITCNMMRRAHIIYPENEIFRTVPLQVRNNKATLGNLKVNDQIDDILDTIVYDLNNNEINFMNLFDLNKPNVIFFSSAT
jgi:hypothetical protein